MKSSSGYTLVQLANGVRSVHSLAHRETFHPVIGPEAEANALYVRQLKLPERIRQHPEEFVIWDVGLGAAANSLTVLRATQGISAAVRILSFDHTLEPLQFALEHAEGLGYLEEFVSPLQSLVQDRQVRFQADSLSVTWEVVVEDFPHLLSQPQVRSFPKPHAILYDAYSPATNPTMWTAPLFANLYRVLARERPCSLATYSRSTLLRVTLLLAGFCVGVGHATGEKEETTLAANTLDLIEEPLDLRWLGRARRSTSAEPLWEAVYRQAKLSPESWERLRDHPQFNHAGREPKA